MTGTAGTPRLAFTIDGLDCAEEVAVLRREVGPLVGGADNLSFDILNARMTVAPEASAVPVNVIADAVAQTGMRATLWRGGDADAREAETRERRRHRLQGYSALAAFVLAFTGFGIEARWGGGFAAALGIEDTGAAPPLPAIIAYLAAIAAAGRTVVVRAWYALRGLRADMNLLMTIAVIGAVALGDWFEATTVACLFALSLWLEGWSVGRARHAIGALMDLAPPTARLRRNGGEDIVPAEAVDTGAVFVIRPGERIPLDGRVTAGTSAVDQAPITGESVAVAKTEGDEIYAGTINGDGALEAECLRPAGDTLLARIVSMVAAAQSQRGRTERWVDRFAAIYTPAVIAIALAVWLIPPLALGTAWAAATYNALVLLVIACPCALVISTPVSVVAALAAAARAGVLVKGGAYLEAAAGIKAMAFDKTGTLTEGRPRVVGIEPCAEHDAPGILKTAAALESRSTHPLAAAILDRARQDGIAIDPAPDVQSHPGKGVSGIVRGRRYWAGSHRYVEEMGEDEPGAGERAATLERDGHTVIAIGNETHLCGLIALADAPRPEAADALAQLRKDGIAPLVMLTGDNRATAERLAAGLGVDSVEAELLPADKVEGIARLVEAHGTVAMVGDGVNDAPALARASLGVAMGAMGSDAAIETADVALMTDDLMRLPWLVRHARRARTVVRRNIVFALAIKAAFALAALAGVASLWGAIAADVGASLAVVLHALTLLRGRETAPARHYSTVSPL